MTHLWSRTSTSQPVILLIRFAFTYADGLKHWIRLKAWYSYWLAAVKFPCHGYMSTTTWFAWFIDVGRCALFSPLLEHPCPALCSLIWSFCLARSDPHLCHLTPPSECSTTPEADNIPGPLGPVTRAFATANSTALTGKILSNTTLGIGTIFYRLRHYSLSHRQDQNAYYQHMLFNGGLRYLHTPQLSPMAENADRTLSSDGTGFPTWQRREGQTGRAHLYLRRSSWSSRTPGPQRGEGCGSMARQRTQSCHVVSGAGDKETRQPPAVLDARVIQSVDRSRLSRDSFNSCPTKFATYLLTSKSLIYPTPFEELST
ncbi:uncharacterized protein CLUP02_08181 [Colletotrichum lupini]|uniref:Uncharacterized protein n=1 Tax=Colletotrichum lupini TaxID=145971 RepID=A0A9Q8STU2_9PEZI|nr:uncharacterized protein CLUP02_08181 [Colletotrichum lupini]UQC82691.1 hypothetical protein CLUP02_08181 [Colletotrichum lupini]